MGIFRRIAGALAMAALAGCVSSTAGVWVEKGRLSIEDPAFATNIDVVRDRCRKTAEGFLETQILVKNKNRDDFRCQYRIEWFDKDNMVQTHQTSPWTPLLMRGGEPVEISEVSILKGSEDFRLKIRRMD